MAVTCPYCSFDAELVLGGAVYPGRRDLADKHFWLCRPCGAYVGCHPKTTTPLGCLADAELRAAKIRAHAAFDETWRRKFYAEGRGRGKSRGDGYRWLAWRLGMHPRDCHIGMFDVATCEKVVTVCNDEITATSQGSIP
jgi:hypothetical protein